MAARRAPGPDPDGARVFVRKRYRASEKEVVAGLLADADLGEEARRRIDATARRLVEGVRARGGPRGIESFLQEYDLSTREGVVLMCLAEALLRVPDAATANRLIADKIGGTEWQRLAGRSDSLFVNASTWALALTGQFVQSRDQETQGLRQSMRRLLNRSGEPVIRQALMQSMRILGRQFVLGRTIEEALSRAAGEIEAGYRHSFDMLGEAAMTMPDADRYLDAYRHAVEAVANRFPPGPLETGANVSIKLTALHPRYEFTQRDRILDEMPKRLAPLLALARDANIGVTIDAEEADRLDLTLDLYAALLDLPAMQDWNGLGVAVQAYLKSAFDVIGWLEALARKRNQRLMIRLVKGAYWDTEIKRAQEGGFGDYPVFTRKSATDVSYIACARRMLAAPDAFYPLFATHNARTVATILELAGDSREFEFQRLHGMGEALHEEARATVQPALATRIYAPVGSHEDLLPYLVRRLLENGANTSFVHHVTDPAVPVESLVADPVARIARVGATPHPKIPLPADLFAPARRNSAGIDLSDRTVTEPLLREIEAARRTAWAAGPVVNGAGIAGVADPVTSPADNRIEIGRCVGATPDAVSKAVAAAVEAGPDWDGRGGAARAAILDRMGDLIEEHTAPLMALCIHEAGKTLPDAVAEIREAVDFCRYYATRARADFEAPIDLPGPTGETNRLMLHGRGVFACISPWNFPLAIFTGQVAAALAAGNAVVAKPAEQTPLIAAEGLRLFHRAGVPEAVLNLVPGPGETVGAGLVADPRIAGVAFTGSTETARRINRALAGRDGPIVPLIAETGGQNAMIVDSTALLEQVVEDTIESAFRSAGQRCSALRVLYIQNEIADPLIGMLKGAMDELVIGDPGTLATDIGPIIDEDARKGLARHVRRMEDEAKILHRLDPGPGCEHGSFFAPHLIEIPTIDVLRGEVFGPILHVVRYAADALDSVVAEINRTGFGLTFGIHSRIDDKVDELHRATRAGNTYVNRNMIGAVVGVQPFGGRGLSGTGPKAGGPYYLHRFAIEETLTIDTTAAGGNATLMAEIDDEG